ncbi:hypothetical protein B0H14DRAFT_256739 [Mycena olivaceomarginata]|nr:hypothetical protein B0H14DRAFT_256739 [Mycena olivaceomarginata]
MVAFKYQVITAEDMIYNLSIISFTDLEPANKTARSWHCLQKSFASPPRFSSVISQRRCARPCLFLLAGSFTCRLPGFKEISLWQRSMDAPYVNPSEPFPIAAAVAAAWSSCFRAHHLRRLAHEEAPTPESHAARGGGDGHGGGAGRTTQDSHGLTHAEGR